MMITQQELMAALPHILAAPTDQTELRQLCFRPDYGLREFPQSLQLTRKHGIPGERWGRAPWVRLADGSGHPGIQVSLLPSRVHDLVCTGPGQLHPGDTMIADLLTTERNLPVGSLLQVGTAVLRVSEVFNDACVKWKVRYGVAAKDWITAEGHPALRLRGILCSIEQDGIAAVGDQITVLSR